MSMRFCPPVTKLNVPMLPVRIGTGFSESGVWAAIWAAKSRDNSARPDRVSPRGRGDAALFQQYGKSDPSQTVDGIVFHGRWAGERHDGNFRVRWYREGKLFRIGASPIAGRSV